MNCCVVLLAFLPFIRHLMPTSYTTSKTERMTNVYTHPSWTCALLCTFFPFLLNAQVQNVVASVKGGRFTTPFSVTLSTPTPNTYIRYTLDGNEPDSLTAPQYNGALLVNRTTTLRARAFAQGQVSSKVLTHTYLYNVQHNFPIVAVSFKPDDFFGAANGIYPNYTSNREVPVHLEMYENGNNSAVIDQYIGTEIQGSASAQLPQKSLEFKAKAVYGSAAIPYKVFADLPYTSYRRLVIRNSGQDWNVTQFRDDYTTSLHADLSDLGGIIRKPEIYSSAYRPVVAYHNGAYWGVYSLKERMKTSFVEQHFNLKSTEYDMVENETETLNGDSTVWVNFQTYLNSGVNFADNNNYNVLTSKIDIQNFIDVMAFNVFVDHQDWPANNNRRFLAKAVGSKWKWISFDYDFTVGLFQATGGFNTGDPSPNALKRLLDPNFVFFNNGAWSTLLFRKCWESPQFRRDFSNRLADMMNTLFKANRSNQRLTNFKNLYADELVKHANRWGNPYPSIFTDNVNKIKVFNDNRASFVYAQVDELAPDVTGTANLTLNVNPAGAGTLQFSTLSLNNANLPFAGTYFTGIDIPIVATPAAGYVFSGWSDGTLPQINSLNVRLSGNKSLTANFTLIGSGGGGGGNSCTTDTQPPTIQNCPVSRTLTTTAACVTTTWVTPTATDNCGTPVLFQLAGQQSGACFGIGTSTVAYRANDEKGNSANCSFTITVQASNTGGGGNPSQDLSLVVSGSNGSYSKFGITTFTVAARNLGTTPFTNVAIKFPYPTGTTAGGNPVSTLGSWIEWRNAIQIFEWQIPNLPPNTTATLNVPLYFLNNVPNSLNFTANLLSSTPTDVLTANNQSTLTLGLNAAQALQAAGAVQHTPTLLIPVVIQRISPNPTNGDVFIDLESIIEETLTFEITNTLGQVVKTEKIAVKKGQTKVFLDANMLQSGLYFVTPQTKIARDVPTKFSKM